MTHTTEESLEAIVNGMESIIDILSHIEQAILKMGDEE